MSRLANVFTLLTDPDERQAQKFVRNQHAFETDKPKEEEFDKRDFLRFVAGAGQRGRTEVTREYAQLALGPGKLTFADYESFRFYETNGPTLEEKQKFISDSIQWRLISRVCDLAYDALQLDKFISYKLLESFGFPVPKTLAIVTSGGRVFPGIERIGTAEELQRFVAARNGRLFFKANKGLGSFAAFVCDGIHDGKLMTRPYGAKSAEETMDMIGDRDFLVQELLCNHADIACMTDAVATIRMTNFVIDGQLHCPIVILKIPVGDNIADNFWRPGNLLANIDPTNGTVLRVIRGEGRAMEVLDRHPTSGIPFAGFKIPFWRDVVELNRTCALSFAPIAFNSLDIAITDAGPVVVEVNCGGSFKLPQLASARGFLTPEVKAFFGL